MASFTDVFFTIDQERTGVITLEQLREYCRANRLDLTTVVKWRRLFDTSNTGQITFETMCNVLGISPDQTKKEYYGKLYAAGELQLSKDIFIILRRMSTLDQVLITEEARRLCGDFSKVDPCEISKKLKNWLDQTYGWTWHVVILRGPHWTTFSHCYLRSLHFRYRGYTFLIWGTPVIDPKNPDDYI